MEDISRLHEDIIHHILPYIGTTKETARVSRFCKTWYNAWRTCPTLNFLNNEYYFPNEYNILDDDFKLINTTLLRYHKQKIPIVELKLDLKNYGIKPNLNEWIRIAVENGVKRLELQVPYAYTLPHTLYNTKSLRVLTVSGKIEMTLYNQVDGKVLQFTHLHTLNLRNTYTIDDNMFQGIIASIPYIENLCVEDCHALKRINLSTSLYNLKRFNVRAWNNLDIEIEAPNLQYLCCHLQQGSLKLINKTEKLKYLTLSGYVAFMPIFVNDWEDKFPNLEELTLSLKSRKSILISSPSLKKIIVKSNMDLREISIHAPNMLSLEFHNLTIFPDLSLSNATRKCVLKVFTSDDCPITTSQFLLLKQLLAKACYLNTLVLHSTCEFAVFVYQNLTNLLTTHETKSWCQELKEVKIEIYDETKREWHSRILIKAPESRAKFWVRLTWEEALSTLMEEDVEF